ncbi:MAG: addiction module protein [Firmicutes bacterium]|nr:addiction module protein [Bacillota bacterium]
MRPNDIIKEVDKLELSEQIMLVADIWDSIARRQSKLPLPGWQKSELDKRYEEYKSGKLGLHDWREVHSVVSERNQ